ncbi:pectinesterase [Salvia divinorum]|uniref:Pectinesterase n=1 Tax=Salvia divinorum TaxID=28513 RepID=A0ABD1IIE7_SALDI
MENMQPDKHHKNKRKILILSAFLSLLVDAAVSNPLAHHHNHHSKGEYASTCAATRYPDLCLSTLAAKGPNSAAFNLKGSPFEKIARAITSKGGREILKKLRRPRLSLTRRGRGAFFDCSVMTFDTANQIYASREMLREIIMSNDISLFAAHKQDLYNLLSAAQTNVVSCLDGFSHSPADKNVQAVLKDQLMIKYKKRAEDLMSLTDFLSDVEAKRVKAQPVKMGMEEEWPEWLSAGDRQLLKSSTVKADVTVKADGTGDRITIAEAVAKAPAYKSRRFVIRITKGVYNENVEVPKNKTNLMFVGDGMMNTIITASKSVVDDSTTFNSATVGVAGDGFLARDITFQNTAGPSKDQAVALRVNANLSVFYNCRMTGYQGTLYVHSLRQFYSHCTISGTVDFIFGNAAAFLRKCHIKVRLPMPGQKNTVTAQGRSHRSQTTGIVIQKCQISADKDLMAVQGKFETYLGRPWQKYSRTVVMQTEISDVIHPDGWLEWDGKFALDTLFYAEYGNTGAGKATGSRVKWNGFHVLTTEEQAQPFTVGNFLGSGS